METSEAFFLDMLFQRKSTRSRRPMTTHDLLATAFRSLRAMSDSAFLSHPKDPKLYIMLNCEEDAVGPWAPFRRVFVALKQKASEQIAAAYPSLACAHDRQNFKLRLLRYPESTGTEVRCSEHTDYGTLSLIYADGPGLEAQTASGEWAPLEASESHPANLVGSSMRLLGINEPATHHRVVSSSLGVRHAIVLFVEANDDFALQDGVTMEDYIKRRSGEGVTMA